MISELINENLLVQPSLHLFGLSTVAGILSHIGYFAHGQLDDFLFKILLLYSATPLGFITYLTLSPKFGLSWAESATVTAFIAASYIFGLFTSIVVYRLFFHPLRHFPGPLGCKISNWYNVYLCVKTGNQYHYVTKQWHDKYGTIVRVGPNTLTINHQDIVPIMSKAKKAQWYVVGYPDGSLQTVRSKETHKVRRKVWDKAFTLEALERYTPKVTHHCNVLLEHIAKGASREDPVIDIGSLLNSFTFEMMGDLTFTKEYGLLKPKAERKVEENKIELTRGSMESVGTFGHTPYMFLILLSIPRTAYTKFLDWCQQEVDDRWDRQSILKDKPKDIFGWLLEAEPNNVHPHHISMREDARLAIIAGSDTTAAALTNILFHLAANPKILKKLQAQIDTFFTTSDPNEEVPKAVTSGKCAYLQAIINEALRLNPPVPNGGSRLVEAGGCTIDGQYIPEGTTVLWPMYTAMRNEKYFPEPNSFIPERWLQGATANNDDDSLITSSDSEDLGIESGMMGVKVLPSFYPFWVGAYSCVGRGLAQIQMRMTVARIVREYDLYLPEVKDKKTGKMMRVNEEWVKRNAKDNFTLEMGEVPIGFVRRK